MKSKPATGSVPRSQGGVTNTNSPETVFGAGRDLRHWLVALGLLALLTLVMFGDVLFTSQNLVLSNRRTDLFQQFVHWRAFGFGELRRGNLALWNPHLFSGSPYFGGFQSALLYPPNALYLLLPLDMAINWGIALHVFLAGVFTFAWLARRGLRPPACFLGGVIFMFCGTHFLHVYAGHLPNLCTLVWAPLLFLALDGFFESPSPGWCLLGMFALAMQVLAGHPQYVFYTGVAAAIYCALRLVKIEKRGRFLPGLVGMVAGGVALSAVQLLTGLQESHETLRSAGLSYDFAAMFSFPPENFLTLLAPNVFGDMKTLPYWGRCYLWEMSFFVGVSGLVLAVVGAVHGERRTRRFSVMMVALLLLLALGAHTPLFKLLYLWAPGFNKFRGTSKFVFLASLFLAMLAGIGLDELLKGRRMSRVLIGSAVAAGFLALAVAVSVRKSASSAADGGWWHSVMLAVRGTGEGYLPSKAYDDAAFVLRTGGAASQSLLVGGATLIVVALLLWGARHYRQAVWLLLALAVAELFVFARTSLDNFDLRETANPELKQYLEAHPGDYRILNQGNPNVALSLGAQDILGYDPGVLKRYAQLLAFAQGVEPDQATQYLPFRHDHPLLGTLRCRFIFVPRENQLAAYERTNYLPHLLLIQRYRVLKARDEILSALTAATFNPSEEVILESAPEPAPVPTNDAGSVKLVDSSTDRLTIEAELHSPGILLVTDTYAEGWRARALPGSSQQHYEVMPADYCLRAIPLAAGQHRLRLEYLPSAFVIGKWISMISTVVFATLVLFLWWKRSWRALCQKSGVEGEA